MRPLRLGIVGANVIADIFATRIRELDGVRLDAVSADTPERADGFAERHGLPRAVADHRELAADPSLDAVFVVSAPSAHAGQVIDLLAAGKHVLVEKPMALNEAEVAAMIATARSADRLLMEAYIAPHDPNIAVLRENLHRVGPLRRVVFVKEQYSSQYDAFKAGLDPVAFDPAFGGGSLLDLGFYPVALAVHLFGAPESVRAGGVLLPNGADGLGSLALGYPGFEVVGLHSKVSDAAVPSQVGGERSSLVLDDCMAPRRVSLVARGSDPIELARPTRHGHLDLVIDAFVGLLRSGARESRIHPLRDTRAAFRVLDEARRQVFPGGPVPR